MSGLNRLLGGSPGTVIIKLLFVSLLVGALMAFLNVTPLGLVEGIWRWAASVLDLSLETLLEVGRWLVYGAMIVVPVWLLMRIFNRR